MKPEIYVDKKPHLRLEQYFDGKVEAWGIFQDRFGRLRRQFKVDITGTVDGDAIRLVEDFSYDDGTVEQRIWDIRKTADNEYTGSAAGVVGTAHGRIAGNALNWRYSFDLQAGENTIRVNFDDWMFLQDDRVMINRARVSKFGITMGEVILFFQKKSET